MLGEMAPFTIGLIAIIVYTSFRGFKDKFFERKHIFSTTDIVVRKEYGRLITSGFLHLNMNHLLFNMFSFYFFGSEIEQHYGAGVLMAIFFISVFGGSLLSLYFHRHHEYYALGASGGVSGVLYASIFLLPGGSIMLLFVPIPIPAWLFAIAYLLYTFYGIKSDRDNIGHDAHLGGALIGLLTATLLYPQIIRKSPVLYAAIVILTVLCFFILLKNGPFFSFRKFARKFKPKSFTQARNAEKAMAHRYNDPSRNHKVELDRILDKVSEKGMQSLTPTERKFLQKEANKKR